MAYQGTAIRWIIIMGVGTFLFLAASAALLRKGGFGGETHRVIPNASPFSGQKAAECYRRISNPAGRTVLSGLFDLLRESGLRPRVQGSLEDPEVVWITTESRPDAPVIIVAVPISGEDGLISGSVLAEMVRVIPPRGMRHRFVAVWTRVRYNTSDLQALVSGVLSATGKFRQAPHVMLLLGQAGSATAIVRSPRTSETVWDVLLQASRRAGYQGIARPLPDRSIADISPGESPVAAIFKLQVKTDVQSGISSDSAQMLGDVLYHLFVTLGYDMTVRMAGSG